MVTRKFFIFFFLPFLTPRPKPRSESAKRLLSRIRLCTLRERNPSLARYPNTTLLPFTLHQDAIWSRFSFSSHTLFSRHHLALPPFQSTPNPSPSQIPPFSRYSNSNGSSHCIDCPSSPLHSPRSSTRSNNIWTGIHDRGNRRSNRLGAIAWESSSPQQHCLVIGL